MNNFDRDQNSVKKIREFVRKYSIRSYKISNFADTKRRFLVGYFDSKVRRDTANKLANVECKETGHM